MQSSVLLSVFSRALARTGTLSHSRDTGTRTVVLAEISPRTTELHSDKSDGPKFPPSWCPDKALGWCISGSTRVH